MQFLEATHQARALETGLLLHALEDIINLTSDARIQIKLGVARNKDYLGVRESRDTAEYVHHLLTAARAGHASDIEYHVLSGRVLFDVYWLGPNFDSSLLFPVLNRAWGIKRAAWVNRGCSRDSSKLLLGESFPHRCCRRGCLLPRCHSSWSRSRITAVEAPLLLNTTAEALASFEHGIKSVHGGLGVVDTG
jgi:hypothetical protein